MAIEDVVIIGAGPAGIAAAIQLARQGVKPLVIEMAEAGGLLRNANLVENYPGFPAGIRGPALAGLFVEQLGELGISPIAEEATALNHDGEFVVATRGRTIRSRAAVVATGTRAIRPNGIRIGPGAAERILYEVHQIAGKAGKRIAIVGAGDAAYDYALNLAGRNDVVILRRGAASCLPLLEARARTISSISHREGVEVSGVERTSSGGLAIHLRDEEGADSIRADYLIFAFGREPRLEVLAAGLAEKASGLEAAGLLHFAGDVKNGALRQAAIAVGDGVAAAMRIAEALGAG